jgi:hypothetical protein
VFLGFSPLLAPFERFQSHGVYGPLVLTDLWVSLMSPFPLFHFIHCFWVSLMPTFPLFHFSGTSVTNLFLSHEHSAVGIEDSMVGTLVSGCLCCFRCHTVMVLSAMQLPIAPNAEWAELVAQRPLLTEGAEGTLSRLLARSHGLASWVRGICPR